MSNDQCVADEYRITVKEARQLPFSEYQRALMWAEGRQKAQNIKDKKAEEDAKRSK